MEWISCEDRLPDIGLKVIGYHSKAGVVDAVRLETERNIKRWLLGGDLIGNPTVTHWMPLPSPPENPND